jgi:hypothetical protein
MNRTILEKMLMILITMEVKIKFIKDKMVLFDNLLQILFY